ncbi:MAG: DUF1926 domain-containing protein [Candidatus Kaelpia aquatica]|nr:DUF1926 domain-containing protein [Candidatus Kaelpia aquatica]
MDLNKDSINFLIAVHAHQPVDNFDNVFHQAFESSYIPFFNTLSQFPEIKISFHISGSLLDWTLKNQVEFLNLIKSLVKKGQLELLSAGYYEPILVLLSDRDKKNQIELYLSRISEIFKVKPRGLWLTERVWEPDLVKSIKTSGVDFIIVDDEHFKRAGLDQESLGGYYITEDKNCDLALFPSSKFLRYSMPFKPPVDSIDYLRSKKEQGIKAISFGDDLEKFGFWPDTYDWVYKEQWLSKFFTLLSQNSDWLKTAHFSDILDSHSSSGRIYLPSASYSEMMDWSGGMFRNFLIKYPESNHLQKRVFDISLKLEKLEEDSKRVYPHIREKLYKAQNNDVYWHGVFGGLYLTHLRYLAYRYLIDAENDLDAVTKVKFPLVVQKDIDLDGNEEIIFKDKVYNLYICPCSGGTITEIDYKPKNMNILNTLTRRAESYHKKILQENEVNSELIASANPPSIHNRTSAAIQCLQGELVYDYYRKSAWIDHIYSESDLNEKDFSRNRVRDILSLYEKPYICKVDKGGVAASIDAKGLSLVKSLKLSQNFLNFSYNIKHSLDSGSVFSSEFNLLLYSEEALKKEGFLKARELVLEDSWFKLKYSFKFSKETTILLYPIYTISDSELGLEKSYQGLSMHFIWPLKKESLDFNFKLGVGEL